MNIYDMYQENNYRFGFFVVRSSWSRTIAQIINIDGVEEGKPIQGEPPYFGNPPVIARFFKGFQPSDCIEENFLDEDCISCPGTRKYDLVGKTPKNWKYEPYPSELIEKKIIDDKVNEYIRKNGLI